MRLRAFFDALVGMIFSQASQPDMEAYRLGNYVDA